MGIIYCYTNKTNGLKYIGQTTNPDQRKKFHLKESRGKSEKVFHKALREFGIDGFDYEVLEECSDDRLVLSERENCWIKKLNTLDPHGYNSVCQVCGMSDAVREKIRKTLTEKTRPTNSKSLFGKKHTPETKEKIRKALVGRKLSDETKEKMRRSQKTRDPNTRHKLITESGMKNHTHNTQWIVKEDYTQEERISKNDLVPAGWKKGRKRNTFIPVV